MSAPLLAVRGLAVAFPAGGGAVQAVDGLSLDVEAGTITALIGASGSGKTAAALALAGLHPEGTRLAGEIALAGEALPAADTAALARRRGRAIGYVFQDPASALNPLLTVGEQIGEVFVAHRGLGWRAARAASEALLARVGIDAPAIRAASYPHQLSGGQRQRAAIAMALAGAPRLLVADEPTTALDVTVEAQILALLAELVAAGTALLHITHDIAVALGLADRIAVMDRGRIVDLGTPQALIASRHPVTRRLLAGSLPTAAAGERPGEPPGERPGERS